MGAVSDEKLKGVDISWVGGIVCTKVVTSTTLFFLYLCARAHPPHSYIVCLFYGTGVGSVFLLFVYYCAISLVLFGAGAAGVEGLYR
jgi:hypothetical protein